MVTACVGNDVAIGHDLRDVVLGELKPTYNFLEDTPDLSTPPIPMISKKYLKRFAYKQFGTIDCGRGCPFSCSFCDSAFKRRDHLKAHERLHTASKPYRCRPCQLTFAQYNSLSYHLKRTHNITGKLSQLPCVVGREFVGTCDEDE